MNTLNQKGFTLVEGLFIVVAVLLLGFSGYYVYNLNTEKDELASQSETSNHEVDNGEEAITNTEDASQSSDESQNKSGDRMYGMQGSLIAYSINNGSYPLGTEEGWHDFVASVSSDANVKDPVTGLVLKFTDKEPKPGEIQYRFPGSCADDGINFREPIQGSYAFRLNDEGLVYCVSSL